MSVLSIVGFVATLGLVCLWAVSTIGWIWPRSWFGDLSANASYFIGLGAAVLGLCGLVTRSRARTVFALLLAAIQVGPTLHVALAARDVAPATPSWTFATFNVQFGNMAYQSIDAWLRRDAPDIVALQEVSPDCELLTNHVRDVYPYQSIVHVSPRTLGKAWGSAVLSKFPIVAERWIDDPDGTSKAPPWLEVTLDVRGHQIRVVVVHAMVPNRAERHAIRDQSMAELSGLMHADANTILAGDLNATSASIAFRDLLASTGLRDSRVGFGRLPTWRPFYLDGIEWVAIDLDHILVGDAFAVLDRRTGPALGSDHLPAIATLALRE